MSEKAERDAYVQKQMTKIAIWDTPGTILVGLGLYAKFGAQGQAFHPLLNDENIVNGMLVVGGTIMATAMFFIIKLNFFNAKIDRD